MSELGPKRAQYRGRLGADPGLAGLPAGSWWYRTDLNCYRWFDGTSINYLPITDETLTQNFTIPIGGGCDDGVITSAILTNIVFVVHVEVILTNPSVCDVYTPVRWAIGANAIGLTIGGVTGTTVTIEALFQGYR